MLLTRFTTAFCKALQYAILTIVSWNISGQSQLLFDHFGPDKGFRSAQALVVHQAKDGYVWLGTEQGLVRYDGHTFRTFRSDASDSLSLTDNYIKRLAEDRYGRLWVGALPCLNIFNTADFTVKNIYYISSGQPDSLLNIHSFYYEQDYDLMWLSTNKGILYSQGRDIRLHREFIPDLNEEIFSIEIDRDRHLWLTGKNGIYDYNPDDCTIRKYDKKNAKNVNNAENDFLSGYMDENGIFWAGTWTSGLARLDTATGEMKFFYYGDPKKVHNGILTIQKSFLNKKTDHLWLGTIEGLQMFDTHSFTFNSYRSKDASDKFGVPGSCFSIYTAPDEAVWIGTYNGLHACFIHKQFVNHIGLLLPERQSNWFVSDLAFEENKGKDSIIWVSIPYQSFYRYDLINQRSVDIPPKLQAYCTPDAGPFTLLQDSNDDLWLSSEKHGLIIYNLKENKVITPTFKDAHNKSIRVLEIVESNKGEIFLRTPQGLLRYNFQQKTIESLEYINDYLKEQAYSLFFKSMTTDEIGQIWILVNRKNSRFVDVICYNHENQSVNVFRQDSIQSLRDAMNPEQIKWIGWDRLVISSYNGFCLVEGIYTKPNFSHIKEANNNALGICKNIISDGDGRVWVSTDTGVILFDPQEKSTTQFNTYNSALSDQTHPLLYFSKAENKLYLVNNLNFDIIDLTKLTIPSAGATLLSRIQVNGKDILPIPDEGSPLQLKYTENSLRFEFTNLNFTNPADNIYRYRLNQENTWTQMTNNELVFNQLGYGNYLLEVSSANGFGVEGHKNYTLNIIIKPPFWRTVWFQLLIIFIGFGVIYSIFRYRELQQKKLEKWRLSVARDLHDDMGSTLSYIRMLSEKEAIRENTNPAFLRISEKTSEVMANMSEIIWSINPANDSLRQILLRIQTFAIEMLEPTGIHVVFNIPEISDDICFSLEDRRHFFLIFKEAINNTTKYARATECNLTVEIAHHIVTTRFSDNGFGFDPEVIRMGNGLKNMKSRAEALKARLEINTGGGGTSISLTVKV